MSSDAGTSWKSSMQVASGQFTDAGGFFEFNRQLAALPFNYYFSARMVSAGDWPNWIPGAVGWKLQDSRTLVNSWYRSNTTIGPLGGIALSTFASGTNPVSWVIYQESPQSVPMTPPLSGNLLTDVLGSTFKGGIDTATSAAGAAGDAAGATSDAIGKAVVQAFKDALKDVPWKPVAIGALAIWFITR